MTPMVKTQVYLSKSDLAELHRIAKRSNRKVAELVREAVRVKWLRKAPSGPVALWSGPFRGSSADHDAAFEDANESP